MGEPGAADASDPLRSVPAMNTIEIRARLDSDVCGVTGEYFWAEATDQPDEYLVKNLLTYAPLGLGDRVRVEDPGGGAAPQVVEVLARTNRLTVAVVILSAVASPDPVATGVTALVTSAFAVEARARGGDLERLRGDTLAIRLPAHVHLRGPTPLARWQAVTGWLNDVADAVAHREDPLDTRFTFSARLVTGPDSTGEGLITELEPEEPPYDGPVPRFIDHAAFVAAWRAADAPPWFTLSCAAAFAETVFRCDEFVRDAMATGHPRRFDDLIVEALMTAALSSNLPIPKPDRVLWDFARSPG